MRLRRESTDDVAEDSEEYRTAIKSVIRCQIQSLLQKLAVVTGEESIVISTNIAAGTYNHLGSRRGNEYLEDRNACVQSLCENFSSFCAGVPDCDLIAETEEIQIAARSKKSKSSLPPPHKSTPRKRQHDRQSLPESPPLKRRPDYYAGLESREDNSSQIVDVSSHSSLIQEKGDESPPIKWIKIEPAESGQEDIDLDISVDREAGSSQNSIINRPKSLIPLANISRHQGLSKQVKNENAAKAEELENLPSEKSILRSLYENQPVLPLSTFATMGKDSDSSPTNESMSNLNVSVNVSESVDQYPSGTSENLVLSGYYDSDSYPTYRHRQKHPANSQSKDGKRPKPKEKSSPHKLEQVSPGSSGVDFHLRTFESGGRLVYACDVCKRELSHLTSYRRHMKLHTMERPHKCPVCDKGFIRKYHCIDHVNKHHKGITFDPETLNLSESFKPENPETSALSESMDGSTSEYNYTLDQSLGMSDMEQSVNTGIDQSASSMLSELAKSAAQHRQLSSSKESLYDSASVSTNRSPDVSHVVGQSEDLEDDEEIQPDESIEEEAGLMAENGVLSIQSDDTDLNAEGGNSASVRKTEVTEGIKAIIAHLKKNKKKLACDSNGTPVSMKVDNKND